MEKLKLWTDEHSAKAEKQGWNLFYCQGSANGILQLMRDDEMAVFDTDEQAWVFVASQAKNGNMLAITALAQLVISNPKEIDAIKSYLKEIGLGDTLNTQLT